MQQKHDAHHGCQHVCSPSRCLSLPCKRHHQARKIPPFSPRLSPVFPCESILPESYTTSRASLRHHVNHTSVAAWGLHRAALLAVAYRAKSICACMCSEE
eukprot:6175681-Pleurochrysis_carterae.AAC.3